MFTFSENTPINDPVEVWRIQLLLIADAESRYGARDATKTICQPVFGPDGPILVNTPDMSGAFARLSNASAGYWPTLVFELAHETVHLLDPIAGVTNYLEEGVASAFSVEMSALTSHPQSYTDSAYSAALELVKQLPAPLATSVARIRQICGRLSLVTPEVLSSNFPLLSSSSVRRLCLPCNPRAGHPPPQW